MEKLPVLEQLECRVIIINALVLFITFILLIFLKASRTTFIPEKYWAPTKPNNRHDLFFKPQQEDIDGNPQKNR